MKKGRYGYDTLVLHSGPNEISNLKTDQDYSENIDDWQKVAYKASERLFVLAQQALLRHSTLTKVLVVKRIARCDCPIKSYLSEYANSVLDHLWMKNGCPTNIVIVKQNLDLHGDIKTQCFGSPDTKDYDGIHLRGRFAVQHLSLIHI